MRETEGDDRYPAADEVVEPKKETADESTIEVTFHDAMRRFEARVPGSAEIAYIDVVPGTNIWSLTHTEVPASFRGKGVGSALVKGALKHVRDLGAHIKPVCPFVAEFLRQHPAEADVVHPRYRYLIE